MRISARCDYACKALLELSLHWPNNSPLQIHTISERQDIPLTYLIQILIQLKRLNLVESSRGKDGGYHLITPPDKISLGGIIRQMSGSLLPLALSAQKNESVFTEIWQETKEAISQVLDQVTFEDIANKAKSQRKAMSFHI